MLKENPLISPLKFCCDICDYDTSNRKDYKKHLVTAKHSRLTKANSNTNSLSQKSQMGNLYRCNCGKEYKHMSSLCKHKKNCIFNSQTSKEIEIETQIKTNIEPNAIPDKELIMMLVKQNAELLELVKNGTHHITHTNSHNKTFNLQFFLNETCKNAMNIMDFVEQIALNLNDLEETGRIGFAEGVSKMILKRLKSLDITERPIHCSDPKRETLYIKDEDKWEKEDESKPKLTKAVKDIAYKNIKQIKTWQEAHPDYRDPESKTNDKYMKMLTNVMAGGTIEEMEGNYEKIMKNIIKETTINKELYSI